MTSTRHPWRKLFVVLACLLLAALTYLDARITSTFEAKRYALPARVFARPVELYNGAPVSIDALRHELDLLGYRPVSRVRDRGQYALQGDRLRLHSRGFSFPDGYEEARVATLDFAGGQLQRMEISATDLELLRLEPLQIGGIYPAHGEDRVLARLDSVPDTLRGALLAIEDRAFYAHWGFSPSGIARAALSNFRSGGVVAGGSTITQQLVKNYYLSPERTIRRKVTELLMAMLMELHFDKAEILESYLNEVYLGQDGPRAIHGFALAAQHYFARPLEELGLHQQALLVGMIRGPSFYNPRRNPERARERRDLVLSVMADEGVINREQATVAQAMPLTLSAGARRRDSYPAYVDLVRRHLREQYRREDYATVGLRIFTALDPWLQHELEGSSSSVMDRLPAADELETASVVTRVATGEVAALVGGRQARVAGFNRALDARRPAGSLLKPAVYLAALEQSSRYTLATLLDDSSLRVSEPAGGVWEPRNFDRESHGQVPLHSALAHSYNQATARLGMQLGIPAVRDMLERLGLRQALPEVPSLVLGAGEYSPLMMARLYQTIALGGSRTPLRSILSIENRDGELLRSNFTAYDRAVDPAVVSLLHYALREVVREGTGRGVYRDLDPEFHVAGKTGTTNDGRDSWFAGFSDDLLTVSWIGRDDNGPTGLTGASGALRIWADFMGRAARRPLAYRMPEGVELHWVDESDGSIVADGCPGARLLPFLAGTEPATRGACTAQSGGIRGWFEKLFGGN
ncbi:MAG: penicillin-binding protein 1B [Halieaceae bacterium]|jgi:penicillin-binding protein 1B